MPIPDECSATLLPFPSGPRSSTPSPDSASPCAASWAPSEADALLGQLLDAVDLADRLLVTEEGRPTAALAWEVAQGVHGAATALEGLLRAVRSPTGDAGV